MIHHIVLENDGPDYTLLLEDDFGSYTHHVDPDMLVEAIGPYLAHLAVGESIRVERLRAGAPSWDEYVQEIADDPGEALRAHGDFLRKRMRETT